MQLQGQLSIEWMARGDGGVSSTMMNHLDKRCWRTSILVCSYSPGSLFSHCFPVDLSGCHHPTYASYLQSAWQFSYPVQFLAACTALEFTASVWDWGTTSVPYHWNITCPLVHIIKVQPAPHHMVHPEPRPAALLLSSYSHLNWSGQVHTAFCKGWKSH